MTTFYVLFSCAIVLIYIAALCRAIRTPATKPPRKEDCEIVREK